MEKNAERPNSAARINPCYLKTIKICKTLGHELLIDDKLRSQTPYPKATTTPSAANALRQPNTTTAVIAAAANPLLTKSSSKSIALGFDAGVLVFAGELI